MSEYVHRDRSWLPKPGPFPREQNYTYAGHTSDIIPTPWPLEGRFLRPGDVRRFPPKAARTAAIHAEINRLYLIENPGRCHARRKWIDAWCRTRVAHGYLTCRYHGRAPDYQAAAAARRLDDERAARLARSIRRRFAQGTTPIPF